MATIRQAEQNERNLTITLKGYGHWKISCEWYGKTLKTVTTNSIAVDDFRSEQGEKDEYGCNRNKQGYESLCNEIKRKNYLTTY